MSGWVLEATRHVLAGRCGASIYDHCKMRRSNPGETSTRARRVAETCAGSGPLGGTRGWRGAPENRLTAQQVALATICIM